MIPISIIVSFDLSLNNFYHSKKTVALTRSTHQSS